MATWAVVTCDALGGRRGWDGLEYLPELRETEVAYLLSRTVWGAALPPRAGAAWFGFESCGLAQIVGLVHPQNTGSVRVLEKCGMTFADRVTLWGMEWRLYRVERTAYEQLESRGGAPARLAAFSRSKTCSAPLQ